MIVKMFKLLIVLFGPFIFIASMGKTTGDTKLKT